MRSSVESDGRIINASFIQDAAALRIVAEAASLNDRLLFEIAALHDGLFECIRWTAKDAERTRDGLFVKTLELGAAAPGFKAMRSWTLVRMLNLVGASRGATFHSFRTFKRSSAFGFLQMTSRSREAFVEGGRRMQRIWLTATSLGLSFQPMAGTLYLLQYLGPDGNKAFLVRRNERFWKRRGVSLVRCSHSTTVRARSCYFVWATARRRRLRLCADFILRSV